jgi:carbon-monoxide dehydrogenase medium subunit
MKPPLFDYVRPAALDEAVGFLANGDRFAKVLAGGQSLVPMLNFRLARPDLLVDLSAVPDLAGITVEPGRVLIGPMTVQRELEVSDEVHAACPLFRAALRHVGHQQTRSRGTVGGSLAHADPAAELPAVALVLDAELVAHGPGGERTIEAADFFRGPYTSALADDEILVDLKFSVPPGTRTGFTELTRRAGDFALGGVAAALRFGDDGTMIADARLAAFGVSATPARLRAVEDVLRERPLTAELAGEAGSAASEEVSPIGSHGASASYKRRLIGALVQRVLKGVIA